MRELSSEPQLAGLTPDEIDTLADIARRYNLPAKNAWLLKEIAERLRSGETADLNGVHPELLAMSALSHVKRGHRRQP